MKQLLTKLTNIIIPDKYYNTKQEYAQTIDKIIEEPENYYEEETLKNGVYGIYDYKDKNFPVIALLDTLTEGFISKLDNHFNDYLWGKLSALLIYSDLEDLREKLTQEIYNGSTPYKLENSSLIFQDCHVKIVLITIMGFKGVCLVRNENYNTLSEVLSLLKVDIAELNE